MSKITNLQSYKERQKPADEIIGNATDILDYLADFNARGEALIERLKAAREEMKKIREEAEAAGKDK